MHLAPREVQQPPQSGATTSAAARGTAAFGRLYTDHFDGLYDFVIRIVRDQDLAGEVVQSTFTKAWTVLRDGSELTHPKAWLYAVARNQAVDEVRRRRRLADEPLAYAQPDPSRFADPQAVAEDKELAELVWSSAAALKPDEYSLLDLHVRHGLAAGEIADALNLERGAVYTRLSRLRRSLEDKVASTLLVRRGRENCGELEAIVAEHESGDTLTPELHGAVRAHVKDCPVCSDAERRAVSPVALFGALVPILPVAAMRDGILAAILPAGSAAGAGAAGAGAAAAGGTAVATARHGSKIRYIAAGGGVAAAAAIATLALPHSHPVHDPKQVASIDHSVGVPSSDRTVSVRWSPGTHAVGYAVMFSRKQGNEPPARENVSGRSFTSAPLEPGRWWFILRTHGKDGGWTHTLRLGPFVITAAVARAAPSRAKPAAKPALHRHKPKKARVVRAPRHTPAARSVVLGQRLSGSAPARPRSPTAKAPKPPPKKQTTKKPPRGHPVPHTPSPTATTPPPSVSPPPPAPVGAPVVQTSPPGESDDEHEDGEHEHHDEDGKGDSDHGDHGHGD